MKEEKDKKDNIIHHEFHYNTIAKIARFIIGFPFADYPLYRDDNSVNIFMKEVGNKFYAHEVFNTLANIIDKTNSIENTILFVNNYLSFNKSNIIDIILKLVDPREYQDEELINKAINKMNEILRYEGLEVILVGHKPKIIKAEDLNIAQYQNDNFNSDANTVNNDDKIKMNIKINMENKESMTERKLFISHSHEDKEIMEIFVDTLINVFKNLTRDDILCTSVDGCEIPYGINIYDKLQETSIKSYFTLGMLSNKSIKSETVLFEIGIAWGLKKLIPIIIEESYTFKDLPKPIANDACAKLFDENNFNKLIDEIKHKLNIELENSNTVNKKKNEFFEKYKVILEKKNSNSLRAGEKLNKGNALIMNEKKEVFNANMYKIEECNIIGFSRNNYEIGDRVVVFENDNIEIEENNLIPGKRVFLNNSGNNQNISCIEPQPHTVHEYIDGNHFKRYKRIELGVAIDVNKFKYKESTSIIRSIQSIDLGTF